MYFQVKSILKNNRYNILKYTLKQLKSNVMFYFGIKSTRFFFLRKKCVLLLKLN